jgi:hypothetical protein
MILQGDVPEGSWEPSSRMQFLASNLVPGALQGYVLKHPVHVSIGRKRKASGLYWVRWFFVPYSTTRALLRMINNFVFLSMAGLWLKGSARGTATPQA